MKKERKTGRVEKQNHVILEIKLGSGFQVAIRGVIAILIFSIIASIVGGLIVAYLSSLVFL